MQQGKVRGWEGKPEVSHTMTHTTRSDTVENPFGWCDVAPKVSGFSLPALFEVLRLLKVVSVKVGTCTLGRCFGRDGSGV